MQSLRTISAVWLTLMVLQFELQCVSQRVLQCVFQHVLQHVLQCVLQCDLMRVQNAIFENNFCFLAHFDGNTSLVVVFVYLCMLD